MLIFNKTRLPLLLLMLLAGGAAQAQGQKGQSMEERLRAEVKKSARLSSHDVAVPAAAKE